MKKFLYIVGFMLFPIFFANGEVLNHTIYADYTSRPVTIAWDAVSNATRYEFEGYSYERKANILTGSTQQTQIILTVPKTGITIFKVKACNDTECSIFAESTDAAYATVDGQPKGWVILRYLEPAGDIGIE